MSLINFISEKAKIGKNAMVLNFVYVGDDVEIGDNVKIEHGAKIYEGCIIGSNSIIGANAVLRPNTQIGEHSIFGSLSVCVGDTKIGDWTTIHDNCHVTSGMTIGSSVFIGPMFTSANTPKMSKGKFGYPNTTHDPRNPPIIEDGVRIGERVSLAPGVRIGKYSLIDMECLITKDIPPYSHVRADKSIVGRVIGKID